MTLAESCCSSLSSRSWVPYYRMQHSLSELLKTLMHLSQEKPFIKVISMSRTRSQRMKPLARVAGLLSAVTKVKNKITFSCIKRDEQSVNKHKCETTERSDEDIPVPAARHRPADTGTCDAASCRLWLDHWRTPRVRILPAPALISRIWPSRQRFCTVCSSAGPPPRNHYSWASQRTGAGDGVWSGSIERTYPACITSCSTTRPQASWN